MTPLRFSVLPEAFALIRLPPDAPFPTWAEGRFVSISRSPRETTVVCAQTSVPDGSASRGGFRCLEVRGEHDLDTVGVVAAATAPLAGAGLSIFVFSVWSTDFLLVAETDLERARAALRQAGHAID